MAGNIDPSEDNNDGFGGHPLGPFSLTSSVHRHSQHSEPGKLREEIMRVVAVNTAAAIGSDGEALVELWVSATAVNGGETIDYAKITDALLATVTVPMGGMRSGAALLPRVGDHVMCLHNMDCQSDSIGVTVLGVMRTSIQPEVFGMGTNTKATDDGSTKTLTVPPALLGSGLRIADVSTNANGSQPTTLVKPSSENAMFKDSRFLPVSVVMEETPADTCKPLHASNAFRSSMNLLETANETTFYSSTDDKALGFNEVMIQSRASKQEKEDGGVEGWIPVGKGGVSVYGQDYVDLRSSDSMGLVAHKNATIYAGKKLVIEAGHHIELRVGNSGITLTEHGIILSQSNAEPGFRSMISIKPFQIESWAVTNEMAGWFSSMKGAWSSVEAVPGVAAMSSAGVVQLSCGGSNFFNSGFWSSALSTGLTAALAIAFKGKHDTSGLALPGLMSVMSANGFPLNVESVLEADTSKSLLAAENEGYPQLGSEILGYVMSEIPHLLSEGTKLAGASSIGLSANDVQILAGMYTPAPKISEAPWAHKHPEVAGVGKLDMRAVGSVSIMHASGPALAPHVSAAATIAAQAGQWVSSLSLIPATVSLLRARAVAQLIAQADGCGQLLLKPGEAKVFSLGVASLISVNPPSVNQVLIPPPMTGSKFVTSILADPTGWKPPAAPPAANQPPAAPPAANIPHAAPPAAPGAAPPAANIPHAAPGAAPPAANIPHAAPPAAPGAAPPAAPPAAPGAAPPAANIPHAAPGAAPLPAANQPPAAPPIPPYHGPKVKKD